MTRHALLLAALLSAGPALADDAAPPVTTHRAASVDAAPAPSSEPRLDLSRTVELTGYDVAALQRAAAAQALATATAEAAASANDKLAKALKPSSSEPAH